MAELLSSSETIVKEEELPVPCLICGHFLDVTTEVGHEGGDETDNFSNEDQPRGDFVGVAEEGAPPLLKYFFKVFHIKPAKDWIMWRCDSGSDQLIIPFCQFCKQKVQLLKQFQQNLEELTENIGNMKKELKTVFKCSEETLQSCGIYQRDSRYLKIRRKILGRNARTKGFFGDEAISSIFSSPVCPADELGSSSNLKRTSPRVAAMRARVAISALETAKDPIELLSSTSHGFPVVKEEIDATSLEGEPNEESDTVEDKDTYGNSDGSSTSSDSSDTINEPRKAKTKIMNSRKSIKRNSETEALAVKRVRRPSTKPNTPQQVTKHLPDKATGAGNLTFFNITLEKLPIIRKNGRERYRCLQCLQIVTKLKGSERSLRRHVVKMHAEKYKCTVCGKGLGSTSGLRSHMVLKHENFDCPICGKPYANQVRMESHKKTHLSEEEIKEKLKQANEIKLLEKARKKGPTRCDLCGFLSASLSALRTHRVLKHGTEEEKAKFNVYKCDECGKYVRQMKRHMEEVHSTFPKYPCTICEKRFKTPEFLRNHTMKVHSIDNNPLKCTKCPKTFVRKAQLNKHMMSHLEESGSIQCEQCQETFESKNKLDEHMLCHLERPFQCERCPMKFVLEDSLQRHVNMHENPQPTKPNMLYECEDCGYNCKSEKALDFHRVRRHSTVDSPQKGRRKSPAHKILCQECGKYIRYAYVWTHRAIAHSNERKYQCDLCEKQFKLNQALKEHILMAHTEGTLKCTLCPKTFLGEKRLEIHMRLHLNIRPFQCEHCTLAFTTGMHLRRHKKTYHEEGSDPNKKLRTTKSR